MSSAGSNLSEYERIREENIKRNQAFLGNLGLDDVKGSIASSATNTNKASKRGVDRKKAPPIVPTRRSSRVTVESLKREIDEASTGDDKANKEKILEEMLAKRNEGSYEAAIEQEHAPRERLTHDISLLDPVNLPDGGESSWAKPLVNVLVNLNPMPDVSAAKKAKKDTGSVGKKVVPSSAGGSSGSSDYAKRISRLLVQEQDVAKLTGNRIYSVWVHPSTDKLIVAAGDNQGDLGLWDVDNSDVGNKGVFKYHPHIEPITKLHSYDSEPSKLYSASYDGTIRCLDLGKEAFTLAFTAPETLYDVSFRDACFSSSDTNSVFVARGDGEVGFIDFRSRKCQAGQYEWCYTAQGNKLNSVQQHPGESNLIVTASAGGAGEICIHDVRKAGTKWNSLRTLNDHSKSINCAYFSPNGQHLVSVSQDHTIRTWTDFLSATPGCAVTKHDNHTGRWLAPFRPAFHAIHGSAFAMGSMARPRRVEVFVPTSGAGIKSPATVALAAELQCEYLGSVCSRNAFHPSRDIIACANSSGRVHILR